MACLIVLLTAFAPFEARGQGAQPTVTIRADRAEVLAGDEVPITFTISNSGPGRYDYTDRTYDRSGRMPEYALEVYDERGARVPDPRSLRAYGWIGGGISRPGVLEPGESFTRTIPLNLWARIIEPGVYRVRGRYLTDAGSAVASGPIEIRVLPRSDAAIAQHIDNLAAALRASSPEARVAAIRALMYTGDHRAAAPLLEVTADDNNTSFWIQHAFTYYLPQDAAMLREVEAAVRRRGMASWDAAVLEELGASRDTIKALIALALASGRETSRSAGALAAQRFPDDRFAAGLVALAKAGPELTRVQAIYALAGHRTDEGVEALRALLSDPSPAVRISTMRAIENAYRVGGAGAGRALRPDDFPEIARRIARVGRVLRAAGATRLCRCRSRRRCPRR